MKNVGVIIANDHTLVSAGIRCFLEQSLGMEVLATVRMGSKARSVISKKKPELLFLYLGVRGFEGLEKAERLLKPFPRLPSVLLAVNNSKEYVSKALAAGVNADLPQTVKPKALTKAIQTAMRNGSFVSAKLLKATLNEMPFEKLTPRQRSVLKLMAEGNSTKKIATTLTLSAKTVEFHRARLMKRLDIYDVPGLVRLAARVGLVSIDQ